MKRIAVVIAVGLTLGLAGCGDDPEAAATASLQAEMLSSKATGTKPTKEQASCIADGMVGQIGVPALQDYGMLDKDYKVNDSIDDITLSKADASALADVMVTCIDVEKRLEKSLLAATKKPSKKVTKCVDKAVSQEAVAKILAQNFQRKQASAYVALQKKVLTCSLRG